MSLAIRAENIVAILLTDGWHNVVSGYFFIDAYEYVEEGEPGPAYGQGAGFRARVVEGDKAVNITGPMTSILAIREAG